MEIVCVGNELLIGKTLNTNAQWMAKRAVSLGVLVKRITVVDDDVCEIANVVSEALQRRPRFIITIGGLGPTFDDKTLEGIAKALERERKVNESALKMIREKYETYFKEGRIGKVELTQSRVKMAALPEGAAPLPNPVGTAPGVAIKIGKTSLIALPGVPPEMKAIFEGSIAPILRKEAGKLTFYETSIYVDGMMESALAPLIDEVMLNNKLVYVKSHPRGEERKPHLEIHLSTTAEDSRIAKENLEKVIVQLSELIENNKGKIVLKKEKTIT